jgi:hypothetical protein
MAARGALRLEALARLGKFLLVREMRHAGATILARDDRRAIANGGFFVQAR